MSRRTVTRNDIDAHSLGVLSDPADDGMATLERYSRQALIQRHHEHLQRLHEGIRLRAMEHAAKVEELVGQVADLGRTRNAQERKISSLWLALAGMAMAVIYFAARDLSCQAMPWNFH